MGRHVQRALDDLRISRIHLALVAILVSFVLTAESCSGTAQGVGGGAPSTSPSSVIATATPAPETLATATPTATPRATPVATPVPTISRAAAPAPTLSRAPASKPAPLPGLRTSRPGRNPRGTLHARRALHHRGALQVWTVESPRVGSEADGWVGQRLVELDHWDKHHTGPVAHHSHVRLSERSELHQRHLIGPKATSAARRGLRIGLSRKSPSLVGKTTPAA